MIVNNKEKAEGLQKRNHKKFAMFMSCQRGKHVVLNVVGIKAKIKLVTKNVVKVKFIYTKQVV